MRAGFIMKWARAVSLHYSWEIEQKQPGSLVGDVSTTFSRLNKIEKWIISTFRE